MFDIRLVIALFVAAAFLPGKLVAQFNSNDSGQYVILSAQYGTSRRHVDVTDRLKQLARQDRTFRMGNSTFGIDPDKGRTRRFAFTPVGRMDRNACLNIAKAAWSMAHSSAAGAAATGAMAAGAETGKAAGMAEAMTETPDSTSF